MSRKQVDTIWLGFSIFFFFMFAVSFLLMPLGDEVYDEGLSSYSFIAGLMFWISIIMAIITQCVLSWRRKSWYVIHRIRRAKNIQRIGVISFFKNGYATIADVIATLSLLGFVVAMIATQGAGYICYVLVSLFVFSFSMHCILNGKVYYHIVNQNKKLQNIEKERAKLSKLERKK